MYSSAIKLLTPFLLPLQHDIFLRQQQDVEGAEEAIWEYVART
jgi:hypothetical protein